MLLAVTGAALLSSCATITRGSTEQIQIVSDPIGIHAHTSLGHACVTPCTLQIARKDEFTVVFEEPGYETVSVPVITKVNGGGGTAFVGNVLVGGLIGMGADASTGAAYDHVPNPVFAKMTRVTVLPPRGAPR
jgi:hypothetical protein